MTGAGWGQDPFGASAFGGEPIAGGPAGAEPSTLTQPPSDGPPTNTLATLSVIFAFVFAPAGAVLGHLGLRQIARTKERGRQRAIAGITLSYSIIVITVVSLVVWTVAAREAAPAPAPTTKASAVTTAPATPPSPLPSLPAPIVDAAGLPEILVPLPDLRTLIGDQGQEPLGTSETVEMPPGDGGKFDDYSCYASFIGGIPAAYDGTNWRKFYSSDSSNKSTGLQVGQAAALFDDGAAAQQALGRYVQMWRGCGGKTAQWFLPNGRTVTVTFGAPQDVGGGITMLNNTVSGMAKPVAWTRLLAVKLNVLLDNAITGVNMGDDPTKITQAMLDRIPNRGVR
jgi:eukaryotic-like serine/threonine-protein kinase